MCIVCAFTRTTNEVEYLMMPPWIILLFNFYGCIVKGSSVPWVEVEALRSLYLSTNGSSWNWEEESTNGLVWNFTSTNNSQIDPCNTNNVTWQGIMCSDEPYICDNLNICFIVKLDLVAHNIEGPLPKAIENLIHLQYLDFNFNMLSGTFSEIEFSKLKNLTSLNLRMNSFRGELPDLGSLNDLARLDISANAITGPIHSSYCQLSGLFHLTLSSCQLAGQIPACIGSLVNLQHFAVDTNSLTGHVPSSLGLLTGLTQLILRFNFFSGPILPYLVTMPYLYTFDLTSCYFSGPLPEDIGSIGLSPSGSVLSFWYINYNLFTGSLPNSLGQMTETWKIVADHNFIDGILPSVLGSLKLELLFLHNNRIAGEIPPEYCQLRHIINFRLEHNSISGEIPSCIGNISTVVRIEFTNNLLTGHFPESLYNLSNLQLFYVDDNLLSGSVTNSVSRLQKLLFLYISNNYISGPIPDQLGLMQSLFFMNFSTNMLTSSIPSTVSTLRSLQNFEVRANALTGSLPQSFENLGDSMIYLFLNDNYISGGICHINWSKFSKLVNFDVSRNELTGALPSTIGSTQALFYLRADANYFDRSLPSTLGVYTALLELTLSQNKFSGSIPSSLGHLTSLRVLALHHNRLRGQVPHSFGYLTSLVVLQLHANHLTDCFGGMYWQAEEMILTNFDMSDNNCYGKISYDIFKVPTLETVALSVNCFSGTLPDSICMANNVSVLSMDGLDAASGCSGRFHMPFSSVDVPLSRGVLGTIPKCLLSLPNLVVLHLAANHFTGTLSVTKAEITPSLVNLSLAHNQLSGTISHGIKESKFMELDLGYNTFTGDCDNFVQPPYNNSLFSLKVNRLSGAIPHTFSSAGHVDVLEGNLFSCSSSTPEGDPNRNTYTCGSSELDQANYVFASVVGLVCLCVSVYVIDRLRKTYSRRATSFNEQADHDHSISTWASDASQSLFVYAHFLDYLTTDSLSHVRKFRDLMWMLSQSVGFICILGTMLLSPLYILKLSEGSQGSFVYSTHETTYAWVSTVAYISGVVPAAIIMAAWIVLMCVIVWRLSPLLLQHDNTSICSARGAYADKVISTSSAVTNHKRKDYLYFQIGLAMIVNAAVVLGVNGAYVYSTLVHLTPLKHLIVQLVFAMFKLIWNFSLVPAIVQSMPIAPATQAKLKLYSSIFNSIVAPCLSSLFTSPLCYKDLYILPAALESSYTYLQCSVFSLARHAECETYHQVFVKVKSIYPPFDYKYMCSSFVLSSYIPVYIYIYSAQLLQPVAVRILVQFVDRDTIPVLFQRIVPGLIWPDSWIASNHTMSNESDFSGRLCSFEVQMDKSGDMHSAANNEKKSHAHTLRQGNQLITVHLIVGSVLHHISILMTFGLCSIVLSICITLYICLSDMQWCLLVNRYLFIRLRRAGAWGRLPRVAVIKEVISVVEDSKSDTSFTTANTTANVTTSTTSQVSHPPTEGVLNKHKLCTSPWEASDSTIGLLDAACMDCSSSLLHAILPITWVVAVFFTLLAWDIAGDRVGIVNSIWIPILGLSTPLILMYGLHVYGLILERGEIATGNVNAGEDLNNDHLSFAESGDGKFDAISAEMSPIHELS